MPARSPSPSGDSAAKWPFVALLASAAGLRLAGLGGKQLWLDEIIQALHSSPELSLAQVLGKVTQDRGATPLDYLIQHFVSLLLGQSEFALRLHAAILGTATIAALYVLCRRLLEAPSGGKDAAVPAADAIRPERPGAALMAAGLYAVYPLHHHYSQEGRPYALFTLLTVCSYLVFIRLLRRSGAASWILYCAVNTLLLYSQYFGAFVLLSQLVCSLVLAAHSKTAGEEDKWLFAPPRSAPIGRKWLIVQLSVLAISFLLLVPWLVYGAATIRGFQPQPARFGWKLFLSFIQELGDGSHPLAWILLILAALGARRLARERRRSALAVLLCWCALPVPLIFLLLWIEDYFFAIRHFLFLTPALLALAALGIEPVAELLENKIPKQRARSGAIAVVAAISLLVIGLHVPDRREDLRGAGNFLKANAGSDDIVVAPEMEGVLSFYFPRMAKQARPVAVLNDAAAMEAARRVYIVKTAYVSAADNLVIESAVREFPHARRISLRGVEIFQIPGI